MTYLSKTTIYNALEEARIRLQQNKDALRSVNQQVSSLESIVQYWEHIVKSLEDDIAEFKAAEVPEPLPWANSEAKDSSVLENRSVDMLNPMSPQDPNKDIL